MFAMGGVGKPALYPFAMGADWYAPLAGRLIRCESYEEAWALCDNAYDGDGVEPESEF